MSDWVCGDCGTPGAHPIEDPEFGSFAKFDPRYTTGYCDACTVPFPKMPRKTPRRQSRLVRADAFNHASFIEQREKTRLKELVKLFGTGQKTVQLSDQQTLDLVRLADKYGVPGFYVPDWVRERYEKLHGKR